MTGRSQQPPHFLRAKLFSVTQAFCEARYRLYSCLAAVLLCGAAAILPWLGYPAVFEVSEAREGVVVREILTSGEWILPLRNGEIVPSKPILFHWLGAACAQLSPEYNEFLLRLPSALAALAFLAAEFLLLRSLGGVLPAVLGSVMLLTTKGFMTLASDGRVDMLFCFLVAASIGSWIAGARVVVRRRENPAAISDRAYLYAALAAGLAALAKGPLGIVAPAVVIGCIAFHQWRLRGVRALFRWQWCFAILLPLPWYIAAVGKAQASFVSRQLVFENLERFVGGEGITVKPPWFYLPHLFEEPAPWGIFFLGYLFLLARSAWQRRSLVDNEYLPAEREVRFGISASLIWFFSLLLLLSLSAGKRSAYLLLILPAVCTVLALRFAATWERLLRERKDRAVESLLRYEFFSWGILVWLLIVLAGPVVYWFATSSVASLVQRFSAASLTLEMLPVAAALAWRRIVVFYLLFALGSLVLWVYGFRRRRIWAVALALPVLLGLIFTVYVNVGSATKGLTHTYREFARAIAVVVPHEVSLGFVKTRRDESFDGFFFYFGRHVRIYDPHEPLSEPGLYLARRSWVASQSDTERAQMREHFEGGRRIDTPEKKLVLFRYR